LFGSCVHKSRNTWDKGVVDVVRIRSCGPPPKFKVAAIDYG
jgi:hypothetical protein